MFVSTECNRYDNGRVKRYNIMQSWIAYINYFENSPSNPRNVSHGTTHRSSNSFQDYFVVFVHKIKSPILRQECSHRLAVLDELNPNAFPNCRVRLL